MDDVMRLDVLDTGVKGRFDDTGHSGRSARGGAAFTDLGFGLEDRGMQTPAHVVRGARESPPRERPRVQVERACHRGVGR